MQNVLKDMFPNLPCTKIDAALQLENNDLDKAI